MKKLLLVVALVALVAPAGFARTYLHTDGQFTDKYGGQQTGTDANGKPIYAPPAAVPDWEYDSNNSERKAESWNWPASYNWVDVCTIPVRMDVGFWVKVNGCQTLKLDLKQRDIHSYVGSVTVGIVTNTNIKLQAYWTKTATQSFGSYGNSVGVSPNTLNASTSTQNVVISLTLTNMDLSALPGGSNCFQVGTVTLQVVPNMLPTLAGGCGG